MLSVPADYVLGPLHLKQKQTKLHNSPPKAGVAGDSKTNQLEQAHHYRLGNDSKPCNRERWADFVFFLLDSDE